MSDAQKVIKTALFSSPRDTAVMGAVVAVVLMLVVPIPTVLLDALMIANLVIALFIILIVLNTRRAIDFSIFPTMLLITTVFGLALNVSSTRLILAKGTAFDGRMIRAFSRFVVSSSDATGLVIGLVMYIILIAVQAMVITKGASRTAEVAARFTLDGYPAKQMAIEAEFNSGAISEDEAKQRKKDLQKEIDFYGQMDGASKFVSGNVKVSIFISAIDLVAGVIVGMIFRQEQLSEAFSTYTILTIGDGLLSQIPALLVSVSTGIIVTRANSDGTFGTEVGDQFSQNAKIYWVTAAVLLLLAFLPGFPWYVLIPFAAILAFLAYRLQGKEMKKQELAKAKAEGAAADAKPKAQQGELSPVVPLDPISLELGYGLIPLVDRDKGAELLERVTRIRKESALDMGLVVPHIRIIDNMRLEPAEYCFKIKGVEVGRGQIRMGSYLAINPGGVTEEIPGEKTKDPTFGLPALWVTEEFREKAERAGFTVVDPPSIIATHLTEIIKRHASEILGRQEVQAILDTLKKDYPAVVDEVNKGLALGEIQKVLQGLLREQVSVRNMVAILETLADFCSVTHDQGFLVEKARQALGRQICLQYANQDKTIHVLTLDPGLEQKIIDSRVEGGSSAMAALEPGLQRKWIKALSQAVRGTQERGLFPIVLVSEAARALVKSSSEREIPDLVVLSVLEIVPDMKVEVVGEIRTE
jgi:flagellar biosynthesis protein FlhA